MCRVWVLCLTGVTLAALLSASPVQAGSNSAKFLLPQRTISAPAGFAGLCAKYRWVCAPSARSNISEDATLRAAKAINNRVNRQVRQIEDQVQYGREELWTLPTARGGDCEDLVLLKKKLLIEHGIPSENLLIATVLDRKLNSHAVLILRTAGGDLVLDSLTNKIMPWKRTGHTFLKLQNPDALNQWHAVLAGGVIKDRPTASR
ncbi:transglutaminase-like cysteine peptidase [Roseobacter sp. YSTF-M11]|uniref:Transglutaminase-like cysteine peptidase n=1 Tax=Roseobacter insulae TaxID=2859783 RepID=A0A9X1FUW0_9RHOB|nr:transglutaminase-like cysteine peptidase [Roseobacter insulae]MBW4708108.1 transglutaminase-like cysteine peptidase [Roseobacter insulae]